MAAAKKFIIVTSIFEPTEAVKKFSQVEGWQLVVVGDKKTPPDWHYEGVTYLSPDDQQALDYNLVRKLPWNHYCRKMVGYLYAISQGAELITDTDDDNLPLGGWPMLPTISVFKTLSGAKFVNIYKYYTDAPVWPRGYPLPWLLSTDQLTENEKSPEVAIWQFLANEDPDVDAIYRLTNNTPIDFKDAGPIVLDEGTVCPFNSQNTIFNKPVFPLLYLPAFVTFRFTDILRGLIAQPLLWQKGYRLGFGPATVVQKRNPHDYLRDFESEVPVYLHSENVVDIVTAALQAINSEQNLLELLIAAYQSLHEKNIVSSDELELLEAWANDLRPLLGI